jgi:site-specific recombinase XerD
LFLGTGIRISELVGLNNQDINFKDNSFIVTRKGGSKSILYFDDDVAEALKRYLDHKDEGETNPQPTDPLFLSAQKKRITVRAVENLVKKYAKIVSPLKKITPHKLRSTYGTQLYKATGDIYIVADVLGHKDVNTTRKHYAEISEDNRKAVAGKVKLKRDDE